MPGMLRDFSQLQSLEFEGEFWSEFYSSNVILSPNFAEFEQNRPTLRRMRLVHYYGTSTPRTIEFIRKDSLDSIVIDETRETVMWGNVAGILSVYRDIQALHGSCWRVQTSIEAFATSLVASTTSTSE